MTPKPTDLRAETLALIRHWDAVSGNEDVPCEVYRHPVVVELREAGDALATRLAEATASETGTPAYVVRECRGHFHVSTVDGELDLIASADGTDKFATRDAAQRACVSMNTGAGTGQAVANDYCPRCGGQHPQTTSAVCPPVPVPAASETPTAPTPNNHDTIRYALVVSEGLLRRYYAAVEAIFDLQRKHAVVLPDPNDMEAVRSNIASALYALDAIACSWPSRERLARAIRDDWCAENNESDYLNTAYWLEKADAILARLAAQ